MIKSLVVGCGKTTQRRNLTHEEVFLDVRPFEGVDVVHDLNVDWPFPANTFDEVVAIHVVEHLNSLIHFMDQAWNVLLPGGSLYLETPIAGVNPDLNYADPTHVRCYRKHTFVNYFTRSEGPKFGYTDKFWCICSLTEHYDCLQIHLQKLENNLRSEIC